MDFKNFFFLFRCVLAVKSFGKNYGHLDEKEFKDMYTKHSFFDGIEAYMKNSYIMDGDYKLGKPHTVESEAE